MPRTITRGEARTAAKVRADLVDTGAVGSFIEDERDWNSWVNEALAALWELQYMHGSPRRVTASLTITGAASYDLSAAFADFWRLLAVTRVFSPSDQYDLPRVMFDERNDFRNASAGEALGYELAGAVLHMYPAPNAGTAYTVTYVPQAPVIPIATASDSTTIDGISGWEQWLICDVARRALIKMERDSAPLVAEMGDVERRILQYRDREMRAPARVVDVYRAQRVGGRRYGTGWWWRP